MGTTGENDKQNPPEYAEIWLVSDADHFRTMHDMIAVVVDGTTRIYECESGHEAEKPVRAVLGAAGFSGSNKSPVTVKTHNEAIGGFVKHRCFHVPKDKLADVEMMIKIALAGNLGGFTGVLSGQTNFHRSAFAFEYAWAAAGMPAVRIAHPTMAQAASGNDAPGPILDRALADPRVFSTLLMHNELPEPPKANEGGEGSSN
jgi:hypothetical protein